MRNRIFGGIGVLWGGAILMGRFLGAGQPTAEGAYAAGQNAALIFAVLLFLVGLYYLFKGSKRSDLGLGRRQ